VIVKNILEPLKNQKVIQLPKEAPEPTPLTGVVLEIQELLLHRREVVPIEAQELLLLVVEVQEAVEDNINLLF